MPDFGFEIDLMVFACASSVISLPHGRKFSFWKHPFTGSEGFSCLPLRDP